MPNPYINCLLLIVTLILIRNVQIWRLGITWCVTLVSEGQSLEWEISWKFLRHIGSCKNFLEFWIWLRTTIATIYSVTMFLEIWQHGRPLLEKVSWIFENLFYYYSRLLLMVRKVWRRPLFFSFYVTFCNKNKGIWYVTSWV